MTCLYVPQIMDGMASDSLGTRIRRARERKHWTQARLADAVGVSARAVGDWERDVKVPRNRLGALEEVLGVNLTSQEAEDARLDYDPADPDEVTIASWAVFTVEERQQKIYELRAARRMARSKSA